MYNHNVWERNGEDTERVSGGGGSSGFLCKVSGIGI
jgi:hypothetical protein